MASEVKVVSALRMMDSAPVVRAGGQVTARLQALGLSDQVIILSSHWSILIT